jgi:hypothetical protein
MKIKIDEVSLVADVAALVSNLLASSSYAEHIDGPEGMELTIGVSEDGSWNWQSGDNSFTGGAYGHAYWGVETLSRDVTAADVAASLVDQALEQHYTYCDHMDELDDNYGEHA